MPPDTVQIGPLIISKVIIDIFAPLLGAVIGGLIAYLTTRAIENRKWEQQKKDKLQEQRREAIALALEWLEPIDNAVMHAGMLTSAFQCKNISRDDFLRQWPDLLTTLASKAMPTRLRVLLTPELSQVGLQICRKLDDLRTLNLRSEPAPSTPKDEWLESFSQCIKKTTEIQQILEKYRGDLIAEYKNTFE